MVRSDQKASRLFSLPGELRNCIYRHTAVFQEPIVVSAKRDCEFREEGIKFSRTRPALALTCHTAYNEIKSIFFEENMFDFAAHSLQSVMQLFRKRAGDSARKLMAVSLSRESRVMELSNWKAFSCTVFFTAKTTNTGIFLSHFHHRHESLLMKIGDESDSEDEEVKNRASICLRLLAKAGAASNGNLLVLLEEYLESDPR